MAKNFGRKYRLLIGPSGGAGFEVTDLHIHFTLERSDQEASNTAKLEIWNLNESHKATLKQDDCTVTLFAGYENMTPLVFSGGVSYVTHDMDGTDKKSTVEVEDGLVATKDTYLSLSYEGVVSSKTILDDTAAKMGLPVEYSYNAEFQDIPNGYSFVGMAKDVLNVICKTSNLSWSVQFGVLQIKKTGDTMNRSVFVLSEETGMLGWPKQVSITDETDGKDDDEGWEVEFLMNAAIAVDDYVYLESKLVTGYFRVKKIAIEGDTDGDIWQCQAQLLEV